MTGSSIWKRFPSFSSVMADLGNFIRPWIHRLYTVVLPYALLAAPILLWFRGGHLLYWWDETFPFTPLMNLRESVYAWTQVFNFGAPNLQITFLPYYLAIFSLNLVLPLSLSQALLWLFVLITSGIGAHWAQSLLSDKTGSYVGSLSTGAAYMLGSYWIFVGTQDPNTGVIAYALLPWILVFLYKIFERARDDNQMVSRYSFLMLGTAFCLLPALLTPYVLVILGFVVLFFLYYLIRLAKGSRERLHVSTSFGINGALAFGGMAFYWIPVLLFHGAVGSLSPGSSLYNTLLYWLQGNSRGMFSAIMNVPLTLNTTYSAYMGWGWVEVWTRPPMFPLDYLLVPLLAFSSLLFRSSFRNPGYPFVLVITVATLFLAAGLSPPTGPIYLFLFRIVPYFSIFDNPYEWFSPVLALGYSLMLGTTTTAVLSKLGMTRRREHSSPVDSPTQESPVVVARAKGFGYQISKVTERPTARGALVSGFAVALAVAIALPAVPLLAGWAVPDGNPSGLVKVPGYEKDLASFINSQAGSFETLALPVFVTLSQSSWPGGGYIGTNPLYYQLENPVIASIYEIPASERSVIVHLVSSMATGNASEVQFVLNALGIRFVIVDSSYTTNPAGILLPYSTAEAVSILSRLPALINTRSFGPEVVYEVGDSHPLVFPAFNQPFFSAPPDFSNSSGAPLEYPARLTSLGGYFDVSIANYSFTDWGKNYSSVSQNADGSATIYFNFTAGVTWPYLKLTDVLTVPINVSSTHYIALRYASQPTATISLYAGNGSSTEILTPTLLMNPWNGTLVTVYALRPDVRAITDLYLLVSPLSTSQNRTYVHLEAISGATSLHLEGTSWSYTNWGPQYSYLGVNGSQGLQIYFNNTVGVTWSYLQASTITPLAINTDLFPYLAISYVASTGTALSVYGWNLSNNGGGHLSLAGQYAAGGTTTLVFNILSVPGLLTNLSLLVSSSESISPISLDILSIYPVAAISPTDFISYMLDQGLSPETTVLTSIPSTSCTDTLPSVSQAFVSPSPVEWTGRILVTKQCQFVMTLWQQYDSGWVLSVGGGGIATPVHTIVDGFFNGWILELPPGNYTIVMHFSSQRVFLLGDAASISTVALMVGLAVFQYRKLRSRRSK